MSSMVFGTLSVAAGSVTWAVVGHVLWSRKRHGRWWV